jgi:hypothetical protein
VHAMKLIKIIIFFFIIYFVRRFIQLYRAMKKIQASQAQGKTYNEYNAEKKKEKVVEADFKIVD